MHRKGNIESEMNSKKRQCTWTNIKKEELWSFILLLEEKFEFQVRLQKNENPKYQMYL